MAAHDELKNTEQHMKVEKSVKYQVLDETTAMIGVVKQKETSSGEMKEIAQTYKEQIAPKYVPTNQN